MQLTLECDCHYMDRATYGRKDARDVIARLLRQNVETSLSARGWQIEVSILLTKTSDHIPRILTTIGRAVHVRQSHSKVNCISLATN